MNGIPAEIGGFPEARDGDPPGCATAYVNTWACGTLEPDDEKTLRWTVTPVATGAYKVDYRVAAGLNGKAKAVLAGGDRLSRAASPARSPTSPTTLAWARTARSVVN